MYKFSDLDLSDCVMNKEPTYSNIADITPNIMDPHGLELPTIIHGSAAEAINLSKFKKHVQPNIEDIFYK